MDDMKEIIDEFLVECYESLDQLDSDFVILEENPQDPDRLASIFRTVHTIKGASGFLAFPKLEKVAHVGENLLVPLRDGKLRLNGEMASSLLGMVDAIRSIVTNIEELGNEGSDSYDPLLVELERLLNEDAAQSVESSTDESDSVIAESSTEEDSDKTEEVESAENADSKEEASVEAENTQSQEEPETTDAETEAAVADAPVPEVASEEKAAPANAEAGNSSKSGKSISDSTIRIDVSLLDKLMNLVGELVLSRNQVLQYGEISNEPGFLAASQRLNHITSELQEGVMKTRMQPIRIAWNKLPRVVRDLSSSCGKSVEVVMEGADTELDKTILEAIKAPLTHIVRNSVDHGIESAEARKENGKSPVGTLKLRAFHEGGQVNIEISDDGGGIDPNRIRDKAVSKGLLTDSQAGKLDDRELVNLILLPGFSTAEKVTNVSGRGVGMDVVKTNIEGIGGSLDIQSEVGIGTTLRIKIPLTLAIVPALIVTSGDNQFAIPQVNLLELVRLSGDRIKEIEFIHDVPVYRLRGKLLPLVYLDEQLELRPARERDKFDETASIVVLQAEGKSFGLVVESVIDTQEIVVKPLGQHLKSIPTYAGATIMGDGQVALILDAVGLAQKGEFLNKCREPVIANSNQHDESLDTISQSLLIVESHENLRSAIRLSTVARLEECESTDIEESQQGKVMQYRGDIMPLIPLDMGYGSDASGQTNIVVYTKNGRNVGIVVGKIVDIVTTTESRIHDENRLIIQDRITEVIDLEQLVRQHHPELFNAENVEETQYV